MRTTRTPLLALAVVLLLLAAPAAGAKPPPGNWTLVHSDGYKHYACKIEGKRDGRWLLRTATWFNGRDKQRDRGIGVYGAVARGSNRNLAAERSSDNWNRGYIRMLFRGVLSSDRLWLQAAAYGPASPWSDGFGVRRIVRCASPA
jgi:hypothetical protein